VRNKWRAGRIPGGQQVKKDRVARGRGGQEEGGVSGDWAQGGREEGFASRGRPLVLGWLVALEGRRAGIEIEGMRGGGRPMWGAESGSGIHTVGSHDHRRQFKRAATSSQLVTLTRRRNRTATPGGVGRDSWGEARRTDRDWRTNNSQIEIKKTE